MSKNINVNPGQYKVGGRERQGENIVQAGNKASFAKNRKTELTKAKSRKKR